MSDVIATLHQARAAVARGWTPGPLSLDRSGKWTADFAAAVTFTAFDALTWHAKSVDALAVALELAEWACGTSVMRWELAPGRTQQQVVQMFSRAIQRGQARGV
jgi:hypothetical protein